jgi:hypothetical protein
MSANLVQVREWQVLHDRIDGLLHRFGRKDAFRDGDFWLVDENWGRYRQVLEIQNLNLLRPDIIKSLQALLADFPKWYITAQVDVRGKEDSWPAMGLAIYPNEIVDDLQRDFLPKEFRNITYSGGE